MRKFASGNSRHKGKPWMPAAVALAAALIFAFVSGQAQANRALIEEALAREDHEEAVRLARPLAKAGELYAMYILGNAFSVGKGVEKDYAVARKWYAKAANAGHPQSRFKLGEMYEYGLGGPADIGEAIVWYRKSAEEDYLEAIVKMGILYAGGTGLPRNDGKAFGLFTKAANSGSAEGQFWLGSMYEIGQGTTKNKKQAMYWYRRSAERGYRIAQYVLGSILRSGRGVPVNKAEGLIWLTEAAERGQLTAQYIVGRIYWKGDGTPRDDELALYWFEAAANRGHTAAKFAIGAIYHEGVGVTRDFKKAAHWYFEAAKRQHPEALYRLGTLYATGRGVYKNKNSAIEMYLMAAEKGHSEAQFALGEAYRTGDGTTKSPSEALKWYAKAAEQFHPMASYQIGRAYITGAGLPKDARAAGGWFDESAALGVAVAQRALGILYAEGEGVERDRTVAYMLFTLAIENREPDNRALEDREDVAKWMTAAEINKALRMARNWKPGLDMKLPTGAVPPKRRAKSKKILHEIQKMLAELGYDPGPADGVMGPKTTAAIRDFQRDRGLPVTGKATEALAGELKAAAGTGDAGPSYGPRDPSLQLIGGGSGFAVTRDGHVLTNHHVIERCDEVWVSSRGRADFLASDEGVDLALIRVAGRFEKAVAFRAGANIRLGDDVIVAGYPLHSILASDLNITTGVVSALYGMRDNRKNLQLTAPVQGGNSGGPVLDRSGNIVAVVVARLTSRNTSSMPQNVNFAVKGRTARAFLDSFDIPYGTAQSGPELSVADIAAYARRFTVRIECWG